MSFIATIRERQAEITAQIAALVAERDEIDAALRVLARFGFDVDGDEPDTESTGASQKRAQTATGVGTGGNNLGPASRSSAEAKTGVPAGQEAAPDDQGQAPGDGRSQHNSGVRVAPVDTHSQHDAGDHAGPDPRSLAGMSNSPEGASDVAADRARKPSVQPDAEPVRQAGGNASPAAPTIASRLRALNAEHPEFTAAQAAEALGISNEQAKSNSYANKIKWASPSHRADNPGARGLKDRIIALHFEHRDWTDKQIAAVAGCGAPYVRTVAQRNSLTLPSNRGVAKPAQPRPDPEAPEPIPGPKRPPALTAAPAEAHPADSEPDTIPSFLPARAPIAVHPSGSGSAVITKPMARAPKGTRFILQDDAGLYLHGDCEHMTNQRVYAWEGSAEQLFNCRKKFPLARDLSERVVGKDMSPAPINREVA